ncbi:MAG: ROK family protein [Bacteroidetes bacterium]|nr:ROK family protein [Bacteroidota bacterium]MBS1540204.1 ROK family protein [Bacteroidota bacterium]
MNKIGVDLGGTNIRAAIVNGQSIGKHNSIQLTGKDDFESTIRQLKSVIHSVFDESVKGIGVGVPAIVDIEKGVVYNAVNISSWKEVPLREILEKEFGVPVFINNDSNCFVLGEKYFGQGKPYKNIVGITLGTGIGSGIVIEGLLYCGHNCGAGEIGYLPYLDHDFEYYCGTNFFKALHSTSGREQALAAQQNDAHALALWSAYGTHIGIALRSVVYAFDPEIIILGGSIAKAYAFFKNSMHKAMSDIHFPKSIDRLKICISELEHATVLGAAALVDHYHSK